MTDNFEKTVEDALDILRFDGAVGDTLGELRRKWGGSVPALADGRFDEVCLQYMKLPHETGVEALGQELSAFGWALYDLDGEEEYRFVLLPDAGREAFEAFCREKSQYCRLIKQPRRDWGSRAKQRDPGKVMPWEEVPLDGDGCEYYVNSLSGDYAAGWWKREGDENWRNGFVADLRCRPPRVTRAQSLARFGGLAYSAGTGLYAAGRASGGRGRAMLSKNPAVLTWFEPSPTAYDDTPGTLVWTGRALWAGDTRTITRLDFDERGACREVENWTLPKDDWGGGYSCGVAADGLGRVYFSNQWYKGAVYRWKDGQVVRHPFDLCGYDHLSQAVPVPGTGRIYMIHAVSGRGRMEECLLELDMDTGRCRIAPLPGMGEDLRLRWFCREWLLVQGSGEQLSDDFAQLINMSTGELLRIRPEMFGGDSLQHIGLLTDGTVVLVLRRHMVGPVVCWPLDFWGFLRGAGKPRTLAPWQEYRERYPDLPVTLPPQEDPAPACSAGPCPSEAPAEPLLTFDTLNFKLAVLEVLMYEKELLTPKFSARQFAAGYALRRIDLEKEGGAPIPEILEWFRQLPVPARLAKEVTELEMDGGSEIYGEIYPFWDGEEEMFDLNELTPRELEQFPNLAHVTLMSSQPENVTALLHAHGVEVEPL